MRWPSGAGRRAWADLRARHRLRIALTLARIERDRGEYARSEGRLVQLVEKLDRAEPADPTLLARALTALGDARRRSGRYPQAVETLHRAAELLGGAEPDLLAATLTTLAITHKEAGDHDEAHRLYTRIRDLLPDADAGRQADLHHNLAGLAYARERYEQAERYARRAVELRRATGAPELGLAPDRAVLAAVLAARHHYDEARHELTLALAASRASRPPRRYEIAVQLHNLAAVEHACGQPGRAEELYREALALKEELLGPDHPEIALIANNLGTLLHERQRGDEAAILFRRALALAERGYPLNHPVTAGIRRNLGTIG
jgi:tetratricopeptide (TPR) repeat protein